MMRWRGGFVLLSALLVALPLRAVCAAPDEELLGKPKGYPLGSRQNWFFDEAARVGSFSRLDQLLPHNTLAKAPTPLALPPAQEAAPIEYLYEGRRHTLDDFLSRQRVTGLLIIKDGQVLAERYQYDRTPAHRFVSHSMAKSIVSLAVGMALEEKLIASLDDKIANYVPGLAGSAYGSTSIRNILRMSSGVKFSETYDGQDDLSRFVALRRQQGTVPALATFNEREAAAGTRFQYASSETAVLAALLQAVTGRTLSTYLTERLWQAIGAEADATWIRGSDGLEVGGGGFNAVLRDYGRLGMLLANDGLVGTRQVVSREYLLDATDWRRQPQAFAPRVATNFLGYGYQFWLYPGEKRRFALLGVYGQSISVDPELKLVMVITAAARHPRLKGETLAQERNALWRGLVGRYARW